MRSIIKTHNYYNGLWFSFLEYVLVASVVTPFAAYYAMHANWLYFFAVLGVVANCLVVAAFALGSILKRESSIGIVTLYRDKELRARARVEHPDLLRQTMILSVTVIIPFWILGAVVLDTSAPR